MERPRQPVGRRLLPVHQRASGRVEEVWGSVDGPPGRVPRAGCGVRLEGRIVALVEQDPLADREPAHAGDGDLGVALRRIRRQRRRRCPTVVGALRIAQPQRDDGVRDAARNVAAIERANVCSTDDCPPSAGVQYRRAIRASGEIRPRADGAVRRGARGRVAIVCHGRSSAVRRLRTAADRYALLDVQRLAVADQEPADPELNDLPRRAVVDCRLDLRLIVHAAAKWREH